MSLNNTLLSSVNFAKSYLQYVPMFAGQNFQPATGAMSTILADIFQAPYNWNWSRNTTTISLSGVTDYPKSLPDCGYIEEATVTDDQGHIWQLKDTYNTDAIVANGQNDAARPSAISAVNNDGQGNITFRLMPAPTSEYTTLTIIYQKQAPPVGVGVLAEYVTSAANASSGNTVYTGGFNPAAFPALSYAPVSGFTNAANNGVFQVVSCTGTQLTLANPSGVSETPSANTATATPNSWTIPDSFSNVFNNLFLAEMMAAAGDERAQIYRSRGQAAL